MLHIGSGYIVPLKQVVMILDAHSADARAYLSRMNKSAHVVRIDAGDKTLIVCAGKHGETCYLSPIAPRTLAQRFEGGVRRSPDIRIGGMK